MELLSVIFGALIGAIGAVVAAIIASKTAKAKISQEIVKLPDDVLEQAKGLKGLKAERLLSLRKYDKGKRIEPIEDKSIQQLSVYSVLAVEKLVNKIDTDSGASIITLTNRGWKVASALDALDSSDTT